VTGDRPRWSVTWLIRIQRIGRDRREREIEANNEAQSRVARVIVAITLGAIALIEVAIGVWLGVLPR